MGWDLVVKIAYYFEIEYTGSLIDLYDSLNGEDLWSSYRGWIGIGEKLEDLLTDFEESEECRSLTEEKAESHQWSESAELGAQNKSRDHGSLFVGLVISAGSYKGSESYDRAFPSEPLERIMKVVGASYEDMSTYVYSEIST